MTSLLSTFLILQRKKSTVSSFFEWNQGKRRKQSWLVIPCGTVVEPKSHYLEVMGLNPARWWAFFLFLSSQSRSLKQDIPPNPTSTFQWTIKMQHCVQLKILNQSKMICVGFFMMTRATLNPESKLQFAGFRTHIFPKCCWCLLCIPAVISYST